MNKKLLLASALALSALALALIGQEAPTGEPDRVAEEPASTAPESDAPAPEGPPGGEPLESFEPTEKLSADSAVSFPVDI